MHSCAGEDGQTIRDGPAVPGCEAGGRHYGIFGRKCTEDTGKGTEQDISEVFLETVIISVSVFLFINQQNKVDLFYFMV